MEDPATNRMNNHLGGIYQRLGAIETSLAAIGERCPAQQALTREHTLILHGPPDNGGKPGLVQRLGRVEDTLALFTWGIRGLWTVVAALAIAYLSSLF